MDTRTLEQIRLTLLDRRRLLLRRWRHALAEENELLAEREADWPDAAAAGTAAALLAGLNERHRGALARIQSSLARIERGTYGECLVCHEAIDEGRLRAVPDADRCGRCAGVN